MCFQRLLLLLGLPFLALFWGYIFNFAENLSGSSTIVSVVFATMWALVVAAGSIFGAFLVTAAQSFLRKDKGVLGEHTLEITDEGLIESTDVNRSLSTWGSSFRIRETARYAFIFVSEGIAHVVPLSRPPLEGSVREFLEELRSRIRKAQQSAGPNVG